MNYITWICLLILITISFVYWKRFVILKYLMRKFLIASGNHSHNNSNLSTMRSKKKKRDTFVIDFSKLD